MRLSRQLAVCLPLLLPCAAQADTIGPDQAKLLQQQLAAWLGGVLGSKVAPADLPLRITGEGDHYGFALPILGLDKSAGDLAVTASVRPLAGGRWAIEDLELPAAANFTVTVPDAGDVHTGGPMKFDLKIGQQDSHAEFDPTLATQSSFHLDLEDVDLVTDSAKEHQEQHIDRYLIDTSLKPTTNGRLDLAMDALMEGWQSAAKVDGDTAVAIGVERMHAVGRIDSVSRERVAGLMTALNSLVAVMPPGAVEKGGKGDLPDAARPHLRSVIEALSDSVLGARLEETIEGLQVEIAGIGGVSMKRLLLGFGAEAPEGKLRAWMDIGLDGLETPTLPPELTKYLPRRIALRPSLSGIQTADLKQLALHATEPDADGGRLAPDIAAIFAHGGVDLGIEALAFDLGPAKIEGVGHLIVLSPDSWRGKARVSIEGFDELTGIVRGNPALKEALPVLILMRGLGKQDGKRLVWDIASENESVTVNGMDLSKIGSDSKPPEDTKRQGGVGGKKR